MVRHARPVASLFALMALMPVEGHTSYFSSVSKSYPGVTFSLRFSDGGDGPDATPLEEIRKSTEGVLQRNAQAAYEVYRHFAEGRHGYARLRSLLAPQRTEAVAEQGFAVQVRAGDAWDLEAWVHLKAKPAEAVRQKLAFDFGLSEIDGGHYARPPGGKGEPAPREADDSLPLTPPLTIGVDMMGSSLGLTAQLMRDHRSTLEHLAGAPMTGLPDAGLAKEGYQERVLARVWLAALDRKLCPPEALEAMVAWPPEERERGLRLFVLLLSDAQWEPGLQLVRAHLARHPLPTRDFADWLEPLAHAR